MKEKCPESETYPVFFKSLFPYYLTVVNLIILLYTEVILKLISGFVDYSPLLSRIHLGTRVPIQNNSNNSNFVIFHCSTNYLRNEPVKRMICLANENPSYLPLLACHFEFNVLFIVM